MKLYTEEQVIQVFEKYGNMSAINARNIIDLSEPIELPSDEEIYKEAKSKESLFANWSMYETSAFVMGSQWMRDKILNK